MMKRHKMMRRIAGDKRGVAAIEFALASSVLLFLMMGAIDLGLAVHRGNQMESAIRAGLQRALLEGTQLNPFNSYETAVEAIVRSAPGLPAGTLVDAALECRCVTVAGGLVTEDFAVNNGLRNAGVTTGNCRASSCAAPAVMHHFVEITASRRHEMLMDWPGIPNPIEFVMIKDVKIPVNE